MIRVFNHPEGASLGITDFGFNIPWAPVLLVSADKNNLFDYACDSMESKMNKIKAQFGSSK